MKKTIHCLLLFSLVFTCTYLAYSAEVRNPLADIPPPQEPLVVVPQNLKCKIEARQGIGNGANATRPIAATSIIEITGSIKKVETSTPASNEKKEDWFLNDFIITHDQSNSGNLLIFKFTNNLLAPMADITALTHGISLPGLDWIKMENYTTAEKFNDRNCYKFSQKPVTKKVADESAIVDVTTPELTAWIDINTRLPVAVSNGSSLFTYTFMAAPEGYLELPLDYKAAVKEQVEREQRLKKLEKPRAR